MAFRADEAALNGYAEAKNYMVPRSFSQEQRRISEEALQQIVAECGPVVDGYPTWHPLVSNHNSHYPATYPSDQCGYKGLDHTRYFVNGFLTCPYGDGQDVIDSAHNIDASPYASINAERIEVPFYSESTTAILVKCVWAVEMENMGMIPKAIAVPLMLEKEVPIWRWAQRSESWDDMQPYLLGNPHGSRSSLFVNQETAMALKKIYNLMVESGMYGILS